MRFFGADVLTTLKTIATSNLNDMLDTIATERSLADIEHVGKYNIGKLEMQLPECFILLGDSEVLIEELNLDIADTPETYPAEVLIAMRDNTDDIHLKQEYYAEALQRIYHGYHDTNISWIAVKDVIRADGYTKDKQTFKIIGVSLTIRIL